MSVTIKAASEHLKKIGIGNTYASNTLLVREALERGIFVTKSERFGDIQLTFNGKVHRWRAGRNSRNTVLAKRITRYKDVTSAFLRSQGVSAAENIVIDSEQPDRAWQWARPLGTVILKSNTRRVGAGVALPITKEATFRAGLKEYSDQGVRSILLERFYSGSPHRCLVVDGALVSASLLRPASVLGDGVSTLSELVSVKNQRRRTLPSHRPIRLDDEAISFLASFGLTSSSVPAAGERVTLIPESSPRAGGDAVATTATLTAAHIELVQNAIGVIPGLAIASVDVMFDAPEHPDGFKVLEVNPAPHIALFHYPWEGEPHDVASAVLDSMFPDSSGL